MTTQRGNSVFSGTPRGKCQPTPSPSQFQGQWWPRPWPGAPQSRGPRWRQGQQPDPAPKRPGDGWQDSSTHHHPLSLFFFFSCFRSLQWQRCTPSPSARAGGDALPLPPLFLRWPTDPPQLGWGACSASLCLKSLTPLWQPCSNRQGKGDVLPCRPSAILLQPFPGLLLQGGRRRGDGAGGEDAPGRAFEFVWSMGSQNQIAEH